MIEDIRQQRVADWARSDSKQQDLDERYISLAQYVSAWSKDPSTKVGCVIVFGDVVLSTGVNGFPRGVNDDMPERLARPLKYKWSEHAERNAAYNAARTGTRLQGGVMYTSLFPCEDCARAIIQCGIAELVSIRPGDSDTDTRWAESFVIASEMLQEAGVTVRFYA